MTDDEKQSILPPSGNTGKSIRGTLQVAGGAIPIGGGVLSAIASAWSERNQDEVNRLIEKYLLHLKDDFDEQKKTLAEILIRVDTNDENVKVRFKSAEYQTLLKKAFRNWVEIDSEEKRELCTARGGQRRNSG